MAQSCGVDEEEGLCAYRIRKANVSSASIMMAHALVAKLWNYCNILRDDGLSYGDYVEQLTFLLFLKMADEQSRSPFNKPSAVPKEFAWPTLMKKDGDDLEIHYRHTLEELGKRPGMLGIIFRKAQNKIQDPAKLRRLIADLIDKEQWSSLDIDVKGDAYEGLLQKNAEDVKGGAGQYFTPRALIAAMVEVMAPRPGETICDPACGTGGFLLGAYNYLADAKHYKLDKSQKKALKHGTFLGIELVDSVTRLCAMNLLLHGIGGDSELDLPVVTKDALAGKHGEYNLVLANPPFGKKSSVTIVNDAGETSKESLVINRDDFWASTSNKQLNFVQHIFTILKQQGPPPFPAGSAGGPSASSAGESDWSKHHNSYRGSGSIRMTALVLRSSVGDEHSVRHSTEIVRNAGLGCWVAEQLSN
jgi:type I restriction enzyme M protein